VGKLPPQETAESRQKVLKGKPQSSDCLPHVRMETGGMKFGWVDPEEFL